VIKEIETRTSCRVKNTKNVSEEEIHLDFYSSKYPDLQFIDLPGFTKVRKYILQTFFFLLHNLLNSQKGFLKYLFYVD
jgi:hypothetical protein